MARTTVADVQKHCTTEFDTAAKAFKKSPNTVHWAALKRAMLHHQQAWQLRESRFDHVEFVTSLGEVPMGEWGRKLVEFMWPSDKYESLVSADK